MCYIDWLLQFIDNKYYVFIKKIIVNLLYI
jgi:hypothetical protein